MRRKKETFTELVERAGDPSQSMMAVNELPGVPGKVRSADDDLCWAGAALGLNLRWKVRSVELPARAVVTIRADDPCWNETAPALPQGAIVRAFQPSGEGIGADAVRRALLEAPGARQVVVLPAGPGEREVAATAPREGDDLDPRTVAMALVDAGTNKDLVEEVRDGVDECLREEGL